MPLDQNPHQTVTRFGCVGFSMYACGFLCPKCDSFASLYTRQDQNELHLKIRFFLSKSASKRNTLDDQLASIPEPIELCVASYQGLYAKFVSIMSPKCSVFENDVDLVLMALRIHFLPQQQYSRVYALFLAFHALVYL